MMEEFMNMPEIIPVTENNIIEEFKRTGDIKHVAKVFCISTKDVKGVLKQAGIKVTTQRKKTTTLDEIGMSNKDFYKE